MPRIKRTKLSQNINIPKTMFKGYMPTYKEGKLPTEDIKGRTEFYKLEDVSQLENYGGILEDDVVMLDVDDIEQADKLYYILKDLQIKCNIVETNRGKHFYFKNINISKESTNKTTAIGISHADIKLGINNRISPIKINGTFRNWLQIEEDLDVIPRWLHPVRLPIDFNKLGEGDGRNQALFNYILTLQGAGFTKNLIRDTIKIINKYIIKKAIPEKELETILRDEAFLKETFYSDKGKLLYQKLAAYIKEEYNIIKINGKLHIYDKGVYTADITLIERLLLKYIFNSTKTQRQEVLRYLELISEEKSNQLADPQFILCANGILNLETKELTEHTPNVIFQNKIPWNYNPEAYDSTVDKVLNKLSCNDKELRLVLEQIPGYCLFRRNEIGKFIILKGPKASNGKSTYLSVIKNLLGENNVSNLALEELQSKFKTYQLNGKLANVGDDISNRYMEEDAILKKLVTGDTINVEEKGKAPYDFTNYSKLLFSTNEMPKINDTGGGLKRRLLIVPFNAVFSKKDKDFDPFIKYKLKTNSAMEYLFKLAVDALINILVEADFATAKKIENEIKEYEKYNNPLILFLDTHEYLNQTTQKVYLKYNTWCVENGYKPYCSSKFTSEVKNITGCNTKQVRLNGERPYIFCME